MVAESPQFLKQYLASNRLLANVSCYYYYYNEIYGTRILIICVSVRI